MICLICRQAAAVGAITPITLERGEIKIVIKHVPGYICPNCGEVYVDEDVAVRLLAGAEEMTVAGKLDASVDYESL